MVTLPDCVPSLPADYLSDMPFVPCAKPPVSSWRGLIVPGAAAGHQPVISVAGNPFGIRNVTFPEMDHDFAEKIRSPSRG